MRDFWVFGYGSLLWHPGFDFLEAKRANLKGFHRSLCVRSYVHRGTEQRPGLVLGLDHGGECTGLAFRVAPHLRDEVTKYLRKRELVTNVYKERELEIELDGGMQAIALGYVVDCEHKQYAGALGVNEAVEAICGAVGQSGPNEDYVINTVEKLKALDIHDPWLEEVCELLSQR